MLESVETFAPVPHTAEDDARLFADPAFKTAWDALEEEYAALGELLQARSGINPSGSRRPHGHKCRVPPRSLPPQRTPLPLLLHPAQIRSCLWKTVGD